MNPDNPNAMTLAEKLAIEIPFFHFGRSGNSLPKNCPAFNASIFMDPANECYKIRLSSDVAEFKGQVQCEEPTTVAELTAAVSKIEAYTTEELKAYIADYVPAENQPIMP
jgi:hypothetical protein